MIEIYLDVKGDRVIESLDLGRVSLGESTKYTVYMKNTDPDWSIYNIKIENTNPELRFESPEMLKPNEVREVHVFWTPKLDNRQPLRAEFKFSGDIFIG